MKESSKKILLWTGVATGVACAVSYGVTKTLVDYAMNRERPKGIGYAKKNVSGSADDNAFWSEVSEVGQRLSESGCERVEITSGDGLTLVGHWHFNENAKRTIIAMHGWRSSWTKDFGMIAEFLHANDCNVLYAEQRGQNESGGDYMGFGMLERYDCLDWVNWVNARLGDTLPVYLCGVSMGASTVLMASGLDLPANVHGIIADCGYVSAHAIWKHVLTNNLHLIYGMRGKIADDICKRNIQLSTSDYTTLDAMQTNTTPILFIHGTDDKFVPVEMTYENYKACTAPKRLLIVPGADHVMSYYVDRQAYEAAVKDFWKDFDESASF